jgi:hypothetical protein
MVGEDTNQTDLLIGRIGEDTNQTDLLIGRIGKDTNQTDLLIGRIGEDTNQNDTIGHPVPVVGISPLFFRSVLQHIKNKRLTH